MNNCLQSFPDSSQQRRPLFAYLTQEVLPHCLQDIALKLTDVLRDREAIQCCRVFHLIDARFQPSYRVTRQVESYILLQSICGIPLACLGSS